MGRELKDLIDTGTNLLEELEDTYKKFPSMYELMSDDFYLDSEAMILWDRTHTWYR